MYINNSLEKINISPFSPNEKERYYSANRFFVELFGEKTYKLSFDAGFGCPNRDGKIGTGGCIFCSQGGSGDFAERITPDCIDSAFMLAKQRISQKTAATGFIAYFQSYTNTYAPVDTLEKLFLAVSKREDVRALSIATRPDCLDSDVISLIGRLTKEKPIFVELGLQTSNESTAKFINRGYPLAVYDEGVKKLKAVGANVITHIIIGLPNESDEDILNSVRHACNTGTDGIKLQLLHVLDNTRLAEIYSQGGFQTMTKQRYIDILCDCINLIPKNVVIHRLTGDAPKKLLIEPKWSADKKSVLNLITKTFNERNVLQGSKCD